MPRDESNPPDSEPRNPASESPELAPLPLPPEALATIARLRTNREAMADLERRIVEWAAAMDQRIGEPPQDPHSGMREP